MTISGCKKRAGMTAGIILSMCLIFFLIILLRPAYERYVENDHAQTCKKSRFLIIARYNQALEQAQNDPASEEEVDYAMALHEAMRSIGEDFPQAQIVEDPDTHEMTITNFCRSGGIDTIRIDPESHVLHTCCSIHGEYDGDEMTENSV